MAYKAPSDPTALTFEEYAELAIDAREALGDAVYERYSQKIESVLGRTATWVLVCGPRCEIVQTAESSDEILTDDEIWEKASQIGYAPFHFFEDVIIEDLAVS